MFCTQCGVSMESTARFCPGCGHGFREPRKLYRSVSDKKITGVCGGLAEYFGMDSNLMRLLVIIVTLVTGGLAAIAYIAAWIIVPAEPFAGRLEPATSAHS